MIWIKWIIGNVSNFIWIKIYNEMKPGLILDDRVSDYFIILFHLNDRTDSTEKFCRNNSVELRTE